MHSLGLPNAVLSGFYSDNIGLAPKFCPVSLRGFRLSRLPANAIPERGFKIPIRFWKCPALYTYDTLAGAHMFDYAVSKASRPTELIWPLTVHMLLNGAQERIINQGKLSRMFSQFQTDNVHDQVCLLPWSRRPIHYDLLLQP